MSNQHLVLAGGGHTHALILLKWVMMNAEKPIGLITLVSKESTTIYSSMIPGIIAKRYNYNDALFDIRCLADQAGVVFIRAAISDLDIKSRSLKLLGRPALKFDKLSIDVGSGIKYPSKLKNKISYQSAIAIKPFKEAFEFIKSQDMFALDKDCDPFTVIGAGFAGIEVSLALRERWPMRRIQIMANIQKVKNTFRKQLYNAGIEIINREDEYPQPSLICTGNIGFNWLANSGLLVDREGRVITKPTLQAKEHSYIFASGDCGIIEDHPRPSSGVWAVRAAEPLSKNLKRSMINKKLVNWKPQKHALQLVSTGDKQINKRLAWAFWGKIIFGPYKIIWEIKDFIDKNFIRSLYLFRRDMDDNYLHKKVAMDCRGCGAKLASLPLNKSLADAGLSDLGIQPEDSSLLGRLETGESLFQSVDGFPALISDPWVNGMITALHACSDLWATGAQVTSAQAFITLPKTNQMTQEYLLTNSLSGIKSSLQHQGAKLVGGHTLEARSAHPEPVSLGLEIGLSVNGFVPKNQEPWFKSGIEENDVLLISKGLGIGVIFASAMQGKAEARDVDKAMQNLLISQHSLVESIRDIESKRGLKIVHACTDITGFGLLGHLGEMLSATNRNLLDEGKSILKVNLFADLIPALDGSLDLIKSGFRSTLSQANREFLRYIRNNDYSIINIELCPGKFIQGSQDYNNIVELIIDPQTCGPLLISCSLEASIELTSNGEWTMIGEAVSIS